MRNLLRTSAVGAFTQREYETLAAFRYQLARFLRLHVVCSDAIHPGKNALQTFGSGQTGHPKCFSSCAIIVRSHFFNASSMLSL